MRNALEIAKREIYAFFVSPIAYVVLTVWLIFQGGTLYLLASYFAQNQYDAGAVTQTPLTMFFGGTTLFYLVLLVISSILTMRLVAEERRTGTLESVLTAPVGDVAYILGKYLAAMTFWVTLWLPTFVYVLILRQYGDLDWGVVAASYLGVFGIGVYYMAIGLLMSTVSPNQIVAAVLTFMVLGMLFLMGVGEFVLSGSAREILGYVSVWGHMEDFAKGIVDSRRLVFEASLAVLALFLSVKIMDARRYEG